MLEVARFIYLLGFMCILLVISGVFFLYLVEPVGNREERMPLLPSVQKCAENGDYRQALFRSENTMIYL